MEHWDAFGKLNMVRLMLRLTWESFFPRLLIILLLVLGSLAFRLWLGQWDPPNRFTFSSFYMAVVLSSYFLGVAEAIVTCLLSAGLAYWAFAAPSVSWSTAPVDFISMGFFFLTSAVDIYVINAMKRAVAMYKAERQRFEILAEGHAALFHDYNERTASYLSLLSAILENSAKGEGSPDMVLIDEASRHAFALSSLHRNQMGVGGVETDFPHFAKQLLENMARTAGAANFAIRTVADTLAIPSDRAALMAIIVAEWAHQALPSFQGAANAEFDLNFRLWDGKLHLGLRVKECRDAEQLSPRAIPAIKIVDVIAGHLGGSSYAQILGNDLSFELIAPIHAQSATAASSPTSPIMTHPSTMTVN